MCFRTKRIMEPFLLHCWQLIVGLQVLVNLSFLSPFSQIIDITIPTHCCLFICDCFYLPCLVLVVYIRLLSFLLWCFAEVFRILYCFGECWCFVAKNSNILYRKHSRFLLYINRIWRQIFKSMPFAVMNLCFLSMIWRFSCQNSCNIQSMGVPCLVLYDCILETFKQKHQYLLTYMQSNL